jgi:hypothetical protein
MQDSRSYTQRDRELISRFVFHKLSKPASNGHVEVSYHVKHKTGSGRSKHPSKLMPLASVTEHQRSCIDDAVKTSRQHRKGADPPAVSRATTIDVLQLATLLPGSEAPTRSSVRAPPAKVARHEPESVQIGAQLVLLADLKQLVQSVAIQQLLGVVPLAQMSAAAAVGESVKALLPLLKQHKRTEIGRASLAVVMAAAVPSALHATVSQKAYAEFLGQDVKAVRTASAKRSAVVEAGNLKPAQALANDCYFYSVRKPRSDKISEAMLAIAIAFWHRDEVTRTTGNNDIRSEGK